MPAGVVGYEDGTVACTDSELVIRHLLDACPRVRSRQVVAFG
jgi:hypothetical protein